MRLRILSEFEQTTNLPQIRSWFNVDRENTVASLKLSLCASVPALCDARIRAAELVLTLDDFELLDDSAVNILRDGDLVCLRRRTHPAKRRAEITEDAPRKRHQSMPSANIAAVNRGPIEDCIRNDRIYLATRRRGRNKSTESSSSSSGSSSDTSSDDTSSDSDSTSGSSSDSGSDSTSSPPSGDLPPRIHRPLPPSAPQRKPPQPMPVPVPPGFGKPQTHSRNERRRRKRLLERAENVSPPAPSGSSNAIPLGTANSVGTSEPMMMSLKNKNKRRGFKNATSISSHITFPDNEVAPSPPSALVPPSERDHLPQRLFVTSVDVEADIWPRDGRQTWDRKRKKTQRDAYGHEDEASITLDYDGPPECHGPAAVSMLDYTALEEAWVNASPLSKNAALSIGCVVGWQELGINPTTLTPEMMLFFARVVSAGEDGATVLRLRRPGLGVVSFSGSDLKDEEEEEVFSWDKILEMQWRLLPHPT